MPKVGADLSANTAFQTLHLRRMYQLSRTNGTPPGPLPQNPVSSVGYRLFDKRRLAGDGVKSVNAGLPEKTHRRQAASHSPWSQQDSGITLSTSMGMIGVLEITLIVPTLCVGMPPRTLRVRS